MTIGPLPRRLARDSVTEAVFEMRFASSEVSELVVGRLAAAPLFQDFTATRLPAADIPAAVRLANPSMAYQPTLELREAGSTRASRIGDRMASWHALAPYPGWLVYHKEVEELVGSVFSSVKGLILTRLALKYINVLGPNHGVESIRDLNLELKAGPISLLGAANLNYYISTKTDHHALIRIATPEFIEGITVPLSALFDIEVATSADVQIEFSSINGWLDQAHTLAKEVFFTMLTPKALSAMGPTS